MVWYGLYVVNISVHAGMRATVLDNGDTSDSFPLKNGVKQGCALAPTLFGMVFATMLHDASQDNDDGIQLRYRTDGGDFNLESSDDSKQTQMSRYPH